MKISFYDWLQSLPPDPDAKLLLGFGNALRPQAKLAHPTEFALAIFTADPPPEDRKQLLDALARLEQRWVALQGETDTPSILSKITFGGVALLIFGLITAWILSQGIFIYDFIVLLSDPAKARGLITFLFSISTIAIAILIAVALFWRQEVDGRFTQAKDLLSILVGILGTILGFYFASERESTTTGPSVSAITFSQPVVLPGGTSDLKATLTGGRPPYVYSVRFTGTTDADTAKLERLNRIAEVSAKGAIQKPIQIPSDVSGTIVTVMLSAEDSDSRQTRIASSLIVLPSPSTAAGATSGQAGSSSP